MEILMSNWSTNVVHTLPESYIFPPDMRPGKHIFPVMKDVPLINLERMDGPNRDNIVHQIIKSSQELGFFQVINHGVSPDLMDNTMNVFKEFFATPAEYKATFYSTNSSRKCRIYSSTMNYDEEKVHYWRDNFTHHCHPLQDLIHLWPDKPARYRDVIGKYSMEVRKLMLRILDIIGQDLQLKPGYFNNELIATQLVSINNHIPCPDPSLTLGMPEHSDPNLITVLHQCSTPGLQVFHHGEWMDVHPVPDAFIVIPGLQLKVISNGKFSSPIHRVMTHAKEARTTIGTFLNPSMDALIEPAKDYVGATSPIYRRYTYKEFYETFIEARCDANAALGCFQTIKK